MNALNALQNWCAHGHWHRVVWLICWSQNSVRLFAKNYRLHKFLPFYRKFYSHVSHENLSIFVFSKGKRRGECIIASFFGLGV